MSIATIVTRGFGAFGSIADIVRRGFSAGEASTVVLPITATITITAPSITTTLRAAG